MSFAARLTRAPIAHDAARGADVAAHVRAPAGLHELLAGAAGCSPHLAGLMEREAEWLHRTLSGEPETALRGILEEVEATPGDALGAGLRGAKRRLALLVALADLGGIWGLEEVTGALSDFADLALEMCLGHLVDAERARGKLPDAAHGAPAAGLVVLAMGKLGARELNFSSDIDLVCLFDDARYPVEELAEVRASLVRVTRRLTALLSEPRAEGYVFRTDLRLRPDASVTPVCLSMAAAERYYESLGRTWERAAYVKARPCAGDIAAGQAFLDRLRPFVWRKHLDFAAIEDAHAMRRRIRTHRGDGGAIALEGHDMKLGRGGIREIEFFTQTRQIIAGGRDPALRVRGTLDGLDRLAAAGWVPRDVAGELSAAYRAHREVEHRLQMIGDTQTHALPTTAEGFDRLARFTGEADTAAFRTQLGTRLGRVADLAEAFFAPNGEAPPDAELSEHAAAIVERWPTYPALRSDRAREIFARLEPELLARLAGAADPEDAFAAFDGFLAGLPAGAQLFALFEANPSLIDLIIDVVTVAPALAGHLARNAGVLDAVIGGGFFAPWPGAAALTSELTGRLAAVDDYERQLDTARRWTREWRFRIGVHHLRGLIATAEAEAQYADLADAVLSALWPTVVAAFATKHGDPPGAGAAVLAMGSLGARALTAASDLDIITVFDPGDAEASQGRRPLSVRTYYARLTQSLVTALSAQTAEGRLYEVDMRLRPSGKQGPVATSLTAFTTYHREEAWTWEHLALTRARPVAGDPALVGAVEAARCAILAEKADRGRACAGLADMRRRLAEARPPGGTWDVKNGPGRAQDIELTAQAAALMAGSPARDVSGQLAEGACTGWLSGSAADRLADAHRLFRAVQVAARLLSDRGLDPDALGAGGRAFLLRATGSADIDGLAARLDAAAAEAAAIIDPAAGAPDA